MSKLLTLMLLFTLWSVSAQATTYYVATDGSDGNNGQGPSSAGAWKTFTKAVGGTGAACGDLIIVRNGIYGDTSMGGTSGTSKLAVTKTCSGSLILTIQAESQRQAVIVDDGTGKAISILNSAYITIDGFYARSQDASSQLGISERGEPLNIRTSNNITAKNNLFYNVNRYSNAHIIDVIKSTAVLLEANEMYTFHRHCIAAVQSVQVTARLNYCNPRGGRIAGGYNAAAGLGGADAGMSMYPCDGCIQENHISDGTTTKMYLNESNADYGNSVLMRNSKILGSICYRCWYGNGIFINARTIADLNHTPQDMLVQDVAIIDWKATAGNWNGFRIADCAGTTGCTVNRLTMLGLADGSGAYGFATDNPSVGVGSASNILNATNILVSGFTRVPSGSDASTWGTGVFLSGFDTWTFDHTISTGNRVNYNPSSDPVSGSQTLSNTSTAAHGMGTCKVYVPSGAAGKGTGTGGGDIGANILFRYINGILTSVPLWDPVTGEFPHGALVAGINDVAGDSLFDFHLRVNINSGGCSFPPGYGSTAPTNPSNVVATTDTEGAHIITVPPGTSALTVMVGTRHDGLDAAQITAVTSSCGSESIPALTTTWFTTASDRSMRTFGKITPSSGTCTITPTFDDPSRVSGYVIISRTDNNIASYGDDSASGGLSSTPTGTVTPGVDDIILGFLITSNDPTLSAGPDQILLTDKKHGTKVLRGALSEQAGSHGGAMTYVLGASVGWIEQNVVLAVTGGGGGTGSIFTITKYRIDGLLGDPSAPEITLGALGAEDASADVGIGGALRIRSNILVELATSSVTGTSLFCNKNAGTKSRVTNTTGSHGLRMYGPGTEANMPVDGEATTQRFSGAFASGFVKRDDNAPGVLSSTAINTNIETDHLLVVESASHGDVFACEIRRDDGVTLLGIHDVTPTFRAVTPSASMGF